MNAVAYLRVSGQSQLEGTGFDRQLDNCERLARSHSFTIVRTFEEQAVSGTLDELERPAFQAMIAYMLDTGTKVILIEGLDRLARAMRVQEQLLLYLAAKGLTLYAANTGENITEAIMGDPMKKALVQIQGVFAELDKSMIVAKLRKGRERTKAKNGRCEGQKPFGGDLTRYPWERDTLTMMRQMRQARIECKTIAAVLNTQGCKTRMGGQWSPAVVAKILRRESLTAKPA